MIPIYKLDKLPRTQKLRKLSKFFGMAENRLCNDKNIEKIFTANELVFFADAAKLLAKDEQFSKEAGNVFKQAASLFENVISSNNESVRFLRALNNVKHLLLTETGSEMSDWDFTICNGLPDSKKRRVFNGMRVYLEDIRSPFNVGAMFRTAESFGVEKIILSPFCADPRHRRAERTAMGCIN